MKCLNKNIILSITLAVIIVVGCDNTDEYMRDINSNYRILINTNKDIYLTTANSRCNIYPTIVDWTYNKRYIIIKQKPDFELHKTYLAYKFDSIPAPNIHSEEKIAFYSNIADSILKNDIVYTRIFKHEINYWLIDCKQDTLLGPYAKYELLYKMKEDSVRIKFDF